MSDNFQAATDTFFRQEPSSRLEVSYLQDSFQEPAVSILDDLEDEYRLTIYKVKLEDRPKSRGYNQNDNISLHNVRAEAIPAISHFRATTDKKKAELAIQNILMI